VGDERGLGILSMTPAFLRQDRTSRRLMMPAAARHLLVPNAPAGDVHGLPGLLADSLPDRYGNRLIDLWLARQGRAPGDFTPVERLCYIGTRGMGALEFKPVLGRRPQVRAIEVAELTQLTREILRHRADWAVDLKARRRKR